jgi:hypothetical protein
VWVPAKRQLDADETTWRLGRREFRRLAGMAFGLRGVEKF